MNAVGLDDFIVLGLCYFNKPRGLDGYSYGLLFIIIIMI
jgi:hypothetical protein